jgi:predicted RecA/RadA family phage recombinase
MATARFIHDGHSIDYTPGSDVSAGDVIVQGDLIGIAKFNIAANALGGLAIAGVFDFSKTVGTGEAIAIGEKVYWDVADAVAKTDDESGANKYIGKVIKAAVDADTTVQVRLDQ